MAKERKYGTFIHGIACSEHLDSSGERIMVDGVDISSLTQDGVFNFEHKSDTPCQIVGKIFEAKKIFSKEDCDTDEQKHFWSKVKCPYVYVAGELFDHVGHSSAEDVAAMLKYDQSSDRKKTKALVNFSIEGSTLKKEGSTIKKCIARKVTITITPCNKMAFAEYMEPPKNKNKTMKNPDNAKEILDKFKKNERIEAEILSKAAGDYMTQLSGAKGVRQPKSSTRDYNKITQATGENRPGKEIKPKREFDSDKAPGKLKVGDRINYNKKRARSGASIYNDPDTWKKEKSKLKKKRMHMKKSDNSEVTGKFHIYMGEDRITDKPKSIKEIKEDHGDVRRLESTGHKILPAKPKNKMGKYDSNVRKALTAGSGMGAPGSKTGGSAIQREEVLKSLSNESWSRFKEKDQLVKIISEKAPNLSKREVIGIAKTFSYYRERKEEHALKKAMDINSNMNRDSDMKDNFSPKYGGSSEAKMDKKPKEPKEAKQSKATMGEDIEKKDGVNLKSKHKSKKGGLTEAGRKKYNKETGGNLKKPVTEKNPTGKKKKRKKSFCARMKGNEGPLYERKDKNGDGKKEKVPTRKKKALDRWNC